MSMRARKIHVSKAGNAIVAQSALEAITPGNAGSLCKAVQSSHIVEETLGVQSPIDMKYLEALAEGAKAFDELTDVVSKLENNGRDHAWVCHCEKALKEGK